MRKLTLGKIYKDGIQYSGTTDAATNINYDNSKGAIKAGNVQGAIDEIMETTSQSRTLTQAEYDALPDTKYTDGIEYFITDAEPLDASTIAYDNTASKMTATNVQAGIDELNSSLVANSNHFYFDYKNGKYGYNTSPNRGADTFFPFSVLGTAKTLYIKSEASTSVRTYTTTKKYPLMLFAIFGSYGNNPPTISGITTQKIFSYNSRNSNFYIAYDVPAGVTISEVTGLGGYDNYYEIIGFE